jgi:uncharacterized protein
MRDFQIFAKPAGARCNLHCDYCYYLPRQASDSRMMPDDLLEIYIRQHIRACSNPIIQFSWHGGEPTLLGLEGFRKIVVLQEKYCPAGKHIINGIQTNGMLLDREWCRFLSEEGFTVGLSLDGPEPVHDRFRTASGHNPTHSRVLEAYERLRERDVPTECLCVVHSETVRRPMEVYEFFRDIEVPNLTFLPLVECSPAGSVSERSVPAEAWGEFLCAIFDVWLSRDIGRIKIQIFEEALRSAFGLPHSLCIFRSACGGVPTLESNGDVYSCDHFRTPEHRLGNIRETFLGDLLDNPRQQAFGRRKKESLPQKCRRCDVLDMCNGGCSKNRFIESSDGEGGLNFLCSGYKKFFTHCRPFVDTLAQVWRNQSE